MYIYVRRLHITSHTSFISPGGLVGYTSLVTSHSLLVTRHSSLITRHASRVNLPEVRAAGTEGVLLEPFV